MIPEIIVKQLDLQTNIRLICRYINPEFVKKNKTRPFAERTYRLFPQLRGEIQDDMTNAEIYQIVAPCVQEVFEKKASEITQKIELLQETFSRLQEGFLTEMIDLFQLNWPTEQKQIECLVGCLSSYPRNVMTKQFFISYEKELDFLMMASLHEINHFVLFEKWKAMHGYNNPFEPLYPDTLWFLEEMAVDPTLNTERMQSVAPYPQKAYEQFYVPLENGKSPEDILIEIYQNSNSIEEFLNTSYRWIEKNKTILG